MIKKCKYCEAEPEIGFSYILETCNVYCPNCFSKGQLIKMKNFMKLNDLILEWNNINEIKEKENYN